MSPKNPLLKDVRRAVERGGLTSDGLCVAETFHLVEEAIRSGCRVHAILASERVADEAERFAAGVEVIQVADAAFRAIAATETSQGILALVEPPEQSIEAVFRDPALVVVVDGVQDPGNAGAILRAAEAFGATGMVLLKGSVNVYNPKAVRASAGSLFRLPVMTGFSAEVLLDEFRRRGTTLFAAMPRADVIAHEANLRGPCGIVIGSEGRGVSAEIAAAATRIRIPTSVVESLNAAVAAGVLLYEAARQRYSP